MTAKNYMRINIVFTNDQQQQLSSWPSEEDQIPNNPVVNYKCHATIIIWSVRDPKREEQKGRRKESLKWNLNQEEQVKIFA